MKKILFILFIFPFFASAQSDANKILCLNQTISLSTNDTASIHHWYKVVNGTAQLQASTDKVYTEIPTAPGYYNYQVVAENKAGCISPVSDVVKIYILPALTPTVTTPNALICSAPATSFVLTASVPDGFTYTYQWTKNGTPISGATASTYTANGGTAPGTITYGINVAYSLNPSCTVSATKIITVAPELTKPIIGQ